MRCICGHDLPHNPLTCTRCLRGWLACLWREFWAWSI